MALSKTMYTAQVEVNGGRDGHAKSDDRRLDVALSRPIGMGGDDTSKGTNPEQLFAAAYAACFIGAVKLVANRMELALPAEPVIIAAVSFGTEAQHQSERGGKFSLEVTFDVSIPGLDREQVRLLIHEAHQICPYSNATRGNIEVNLNAA